jgi:hypothetical protein
MFKRLISLVLCLMLLVTSSAAKAGGVSLPDSPAPVPGEVDVGSAISPLKKGQIAPFTGVLLSPKATATIITQLNSLDALVKIEVDKAKSESKAQCDFAIAEQKNQLETDKKVLQASIDEKLKRITILENQVKEAEASRPNVVIWAGIGFAGGIAVTVLTVYAVSQATR